MLLDSAEALVDELEKLRLLADTEGSIWSLRSRTMASIDDLAPGEAVLEDRETDHGAFPNQRARSRSSSASLVLTVWPDEVGPYLAVETSVLDNDCTPAKRPVSPASTVRPEEVTFYLELARQDARISHDVDQRHRRTVASSIVEDRTAELGKSRTLRYLREHVSNCQQPMSFTWLYALVHLSTMARGTNIHSNVQLVPGLYHTLNKEMATPRPSTDFEFVLKDAQEMMAQVAQLPTAST